MDMDIFSNPFEEPCFEDQVAGICAICGRPTVLLPGSATSGTTATACCQGPLDTRREALWAAKDRSRAPPGRGAAHLPSRDWLEAMKRAREGEGQTRILLYAVKTRCTAYVELFSRLIRGGTESVVIPVIPDEHNSHPGLLVTPEDEPWRFPTKEGCFEAALEVEQVAIGYLRFWEERQRSRPVYCKVA